MQEPQNENSPPATAKSSVAGAIANGVKSAPSRSFDYLQSFRPTRLPQMARRNYALEMRATIAYAAMLTLFESSIIGVIIKIQFEDAVEAGVLNLAVAIVTSAKAFSNITSFVWVKLAHGRDKVAVVTGLQLTMALLCIAMGLAYLPRSEWGMWTMVGVVVLARCVWAGFITLRSTIWRQNYRRASRAQVTGKITALQVVGLGVLGALLGALMDSDPDWFLAFIVLAFIAAPVGLLSWRKVRVRREKTLIRDEKRDTDLAPGLNPLSMIKILRGDRAFAGYMACMFMLGSGNLMIPTLLPIVFRERFGLYNFESILLASTIPAFVMPLAIPIWAKLLDRMHIIRYRFYHCWFFFVAQALMLTAAFLGEVWLLYLASIVLGAAFGGGAIAWTLGHLDFAKPHQATQYMGVHVTLTGVRGLLAPLVGVHLYELFKLTGHGYLVFTVSMALVALAAIGFMWVRKYAPKPEPTGPEHEKRQEEIAPAPPTRVSQ